MSKTGNGTGYLVQPQGVMRGVITVPGDKSISHRSIMLGALCDGTVEVTGFLEGEDSLATLVAFRAMGVSIDGPKQGRVVIQGVGMHGLKAATKALDLGNSGTSMRLLSGLLAGQSFDTTLVGDASLSKRPMARVAIPLAEMGARLQLTEAGTAPITVSGTGALVGIDYSMPVASAQVKSCLLLAGMYANGQTCVTEPAPTRDHTERMLQAFGYPVSVEANRICIEGGHTLTAAPITVPADISSAAFFMVAAAIAPGSDLTIQNVGINPTRTGIIEILKLMGADLQLHNERLFGGEPVADIQIKHSQLHGITIPEELVPLAIDEFPVVFVAAACAAGDTVLTGAEELRVKESDRIQAMADGLQAIGVQAEPTADGIRIQGGPIQGGSVDSLGDHRIAMAFAVAALRAEQAIRIADCNNVRTSFPNFVELAQQAGLTISLT